MRLGDKEPLSKSEIPHLAGVYSFSKQAYLL